jgi:hypothetical protein
MGIRDWIMRQIIKAPWLDDQKRAEQEARLTKIQEELDREFKKDGLQQSERTSGFRSAYAAARNMLERRAERREAGGITERERFDRAVKKGEAEAIAEPQARESVVLKRRIDEARKKLERERIARP